MIKIYLLQASIFLFLLSEFSFGQSGFNIIKSWDFESQAVDDEFTDEDLINYMDMQGLIDFEYPINQILYDSINGNQTKVMRIKDLAKTYYHGFGANAPLGSNYNEVYCSYNWKFSNEFNNTSGGKLPGLIGLPMDPDMGPYNPRRDYGPYAINLFKFYGNIASYHYDNTKSGSPWTTDEYKFDSIYFSNGTWYNITQRLVLNTFTNGVANADGIKELWVDGKLIFQETGLKLVIKDDPNLKINAFRLAHFYGGTTDDYLPLHDCYAYIDNIKIYTPENDPTFGTHQLHNANEVLKVPDEITLKNFFYDKLIKNEGTLSNEEYGSSYSPCIDEAYLVDAGQGNHVSYSLNWTIGGRDALFFYDGNTTDSRLIRIVEGYNQADNQLIESSSRYLFVRFSSNTDGGTAGFKGTIEFVNGDDEPIHPANHSPVITDQAFSLKENEFSGNIIGIIIASDPDADQSVTFAITGGNESGLFIINPSTGVLTTTSSDLFDFDLSEYNLNIMVTDNALQPLSSTAKVTITFLRFQNNIYIDPGNVGDPHENGTIEHPYDSWNDISWKNGCNYFQKRGTTAIVDNIAIGADFVSISTYGDGADPIIKSETNEYVISVYQNHDVTISNLVIYDEQASAAIYFLGELCDNIIVENCHLENVVNGIKIVAAHRFICRYNKISARDNAIFSTSALNEIYYNILINSEYGTLLPGTSTKANFFNNVFCNNVQGIYSSSAEITLYNNIFYLSQRSQKAIVQQSDKIFADNNIYYPQYDGFISVNSVSYADLPTLNQQLNIDLHSANNDPLFTDVLNGEFSLQPKSNAINNGRNLNLQKDFFGQSVPAYGTPDIGISEYSGNLPNKAEDEKSVMSIYPNPSDGNVHIDITIPQGEAGVNSVLKIMDMQGRIIYSKENNVTEPFSEYIPDLSHQPNGAYLTVYLYGRNIIQEKLIINK